MTQILHPFKKAIMPRMIFKRSVEAHLVTAARFPGTTVAVSPYLVHRNNEVYKNPAKFDPDRWLTGEPVANIDFLPFGMMTLKTLVLWQRTGASLVIKDALFRFWGFWYKGRRTLLRSG
jgi:hypothetical protein